MSAARLDHEFYQGDYYPHLFTFQTKAGTPIDISARTYEAEIRHDKKQTVPDATFTTTVTDGPNGKLLIELSEEDTAALGPPCDYFWSLREIIDGKGRTIVVGKVTVLLPATW